MKIKKILPVLFLFGILISCGEGKQNEELASVDHKSANVNLPQNDDAEHYVAQLDTSELLSGKSLYYSKPDGETVSVEFWLNDSNQVIKLIEYYTTENGGSINRKCFYYRDNHKYVTKEYFDDSHGEESGFIERITYYKNGKPAVTKMRRAPYEDQLEYQEFVKAPLEDCSDERAYEVLGQKGEYQTNFRGFIKDKHMTYLLVGSNDKDGYTSSISVQYQTNAVRKLLANERQMIGKPLVVSFETTVSEIGFEFQVLTGLQIVEE